MTPTEHENRVVRARARLIDPTLDRLRADLIADQVGIWMTSRAMGRTFAASAWVLLAVLYAGAWGWLWGVPLVVGGIATWLQASGLLDRQTARSSRDQDARAAGLRRLVRLSSRPQMLDGPRLAEAAGVLLAGAATGHLIGVFQRDDAAIVATGMVVLSAVLTLANLVAHPSFARYSGPPPFWAQRRMTALAAGPLMVLLLWPASADGPALLLTALGGLLLTGSGLRWAAHLDRTDAAIEDGLRDAYQAAIKELFFSMHNGLRNPARSVMSAVAAEVAAGRALETALATLGPAQATTVREWRRADDRARQLTWELATRISEYVEMTRVGTAERPRRAADLVHAILQYHGTARDHLTWRVTHQLDPASMSSLDNDFVAMCLTEFVTNAVVARATDVLVSVDTDHESLSDTITVSVTCACGDRLPSGRPRAGTLALIAEEIEQVNGKLRIADHGDGSHTTSATWPTDAAPSRIPPLPFAGTEG